MKSFCSRCVLKNIQLEQDFPSIQWACVEINLFIDMATDWLIQVYIGLTMKGSPKCSYHEHQSCHKRKYRYTETSEMEACLSRNPYFQHKNMLNSWALGKRLFLLMWNVIWRLPFCRFSNCKSPMLHEQEIEKLFIMSLNQTWLQKLCLNSICICQKWVKPSCVLILLCCTLNYLDHITSIIN